MRETKAVKANTAGVAEAIKFVEDFLGEYGIKKKALLRAVLTMEESVGSLAAHAKPGSDINILISAFTRR